MEMKKKDSGLHDVIAIAKDRIYLFMFYTVRYIGITYEKIHSRFCDIENNKVVFDNFGGRGYGDSPKYIAEEIRRQGLNWDLVWLANDVNTPVPQGIRVVREGTGKAVWERATAKVWVDNIRWLVRPKKRTGQICLQTWHGGLNFKYVEGAVADKLTRAYIRMAKEDGKNCDGIVSGCALRSEEYRKYFWLGEQTEVLEFGLPRNDILFRQDVISKKYLSVRRHFGLNPDQKVVLYMPTFRDDGSMKGYALDYEGLLRALERKLGEDCAIIVRLHPNAQRLTDSIPYSKKIVNGTGYPDAQELYMASDIMITDYSSAAFDFALLERPVFLCLLDHADYVKMRGLNQVFDSCPFPHCYSNEELIAAIENFSDSEYESKMNEFKKIWKPFDNGHAAEQIVEWLKQKIEIKQ